MPKVTVTMDADRENMLNVLYDGDECYHQKLEEMSDEELIEEGIRLGCWQRYSPNTGGTQ